VIASLIRCVLPPACTVSPSSKAGGSAATAATAAATAAITVSAATAATTAATANASATASSSAAAATAVRASKPFGRTTAIEGRRLRHGHDGGSDIDARFAAATNAPAPGVPPVPSPVSSAGQSPCGQKRSLGVYDGCVLRAALAAARRTP
jgi:hypothetical protein